MQMREGYSKHNFFVIPEYRIEQAANKVFYGIKKSMTHEKVLLEGRKRILISVFYDFDSIYFDSEQCRICKRHWSHL